MVLLNKNTIMCYVSNVNSEYSTVSVFRWLKHEINIPQSELDMSQLNPSYIRLKFKDEIALNRIVSKYGNTVQFTTDDKIRHNLPFKRGDQQSIRVRIFYLPYEITSQEIQDYMSQYGTILKKYEEILQGGY